MIDNTTFIAHAFARCSADEVPWVAAFPGDVATAPHSVWFGAKALPLPPFIRDSHNNYVCISTFKRGTNGQYRRRKECFSGLHLILLDDLGTKIPLERLRLQPSCLVETSPGNFQAWLFLKEPERDPQRAEALINGLIAAGATDDGAGSLTRFGRLPVGINGKAKYADENDQPFTQRLHKWSPEHRYSVDEVAKAYAIDLTPASRTKQRPAAPKGAGNHTALLDATGLYLEPMRGMEGGHRITCPWWERHTDRDTSGTVYFEPSPNNEMRGGFKCHHGHCKDRSIINLDHFISRLVAGGEK